FLSGLEPLGRRPLPLRPELALLLVLYPMLRPLRPMARPGVSIGLTSVRAGRRGCARLCGRGSGWLRRSRCRRSFTLSPALLCSRTLTRENPAAVCDPARTPDLDQLRLGGRQNHSRIGGGGILYRRRRCLRRG